MVHTSRSKGDREAYRPASIQFDVHNRSGTSRVTSVAGRKHTARRPHGAAQIGGVSLLHLAAPRQAPHALRKASGVRRL